jgi:hypothetical protein
MSHISDRDVEYLEPYFSNLPLSTLCHSVYDRLSRTKVGAGLNHSRDCALHASVWVIDREPMIFGYYKKLGDLKKAEPFIYWTILKSIVFMDTELGISKNNFTEKRIDF